MTNLARTLAAICFLAGCSGCSMTDPYERSGMWQPDGVVQGNMAAMVANPNDLVAGHGPASPATYGSHAVQDLWTGHPKPLLTKSDSSSSGSSDASSSAGGGS